MACIGFLSERSSVKFQLPSKTGLERRTSEARTNEAGRRLRETGRWAPGGVAAFFDMLRLRKIAYVHFKWAGVGLQRPHE
jgi:hypothetical protein